MNYTAKTISRMSESQVDYLKTTRMGQKGFESQLVLVRREVPQWVGYVDE